MLDVETSSPLAAEEFELPNIEASSTSRSSSHPQDVSGAAVAPGRKSLSGGTRSGRRTITIPASPTPTNIIFTRRDDDDHGLDIEDIEAGPSTTTNPRRPPPGGRPKGKQHRRASSGVSNTTPDTPQGSHRRMLHLPADSDGAAVDPIFSLSRSKTRDLAAAAGETVEVPDFSHFLGLHHTAEEGETDNYARAARMRNGWKRRLFLLMEEPGSSSEAFAVHVVVTGSIVFRCGAREIRFRLLEIQCRPRTFFAAPCSRSCQHSRLFIPMRKRPRPSSASIRPSSCFSP